MNYYSLLRAHGIRSAACHHGVSTSALQDFSDFIASSVCAMYPFLPFVVFCEFCFATVTEDVFASVFSFVFHFCLHVCSTGVLLIHDYLEHFCFQPSFSFSSASTSASEEFCYFMITWDIPASSLSSPSDLLPLLPQRSSGFHDYVGHFCFQPFFSFSSASTSAPEEFCYFMITWDIPASSRSSPSDLLPLLPQRSSGFHIIIRYSYLTHITLNFC